MNSLERCLAVLNKKIPDRVPVIPENYNFCIWYSGYKMKDVYKNGRLLAECMIRTWERFRYDGVAVDLDNAVLGESLGCPVDFRDDDPAVITGPAIQNYDEVEMFKVPDPYKDGRLAVYLDCTHHLQQKLGKEILITAFCDQGPFSLGAMVRGKEQFLIDLAMAENTEQIHRLLDFCRRVGAVFAKALFESGAHAVSFGDALASPDLISPLYYEKFVFPHEKRMIENMKKMGTYAGIHICGNVTAILPKLVETGADMLDIDYKTDLKSAKDTCKGKTVIRGPIDPASVLRYGNLRLVEEKCKEAIEILGKDGGLLLSGGCDIMRETPAENMQAMVEAAKKFGKYKKSI